jgi:hypothetical protein
MKALSVFYPRIIPYLPGVSEPLVDQVLVDSAIHFCESSLVLRENLDSFNTSIGQIEYDLDAPSTQHAIERVMGVALDDVALSGVMYETLRNDLSTGNVRPQGFYTDRTGSTFVLRLTPPPDDSYSVVVNVALRPARSATLLEDDLYNIWIDPIVSGAVARAMQIPDQPFTNFGQAQYLLNSAARQTVNSRVESNYGLIRGSMRARSRPIA